MIISESIAFKKVPQLNILFSVSADSVITSVQKNKSEPNDFSNDIVNTIFCLHYVTKAGHPKRDV